MINVIQVLKVYDNINVKQKREGEVFKGKNKLLYIDNNNEIKLTCILIDEMCYIYIKASCSSIFWELFF